MVSPTSRLGYLADSSTSSGLFFTVGALFWTVIGLGLYLDL